MTGTKVLGAIAAVAVGMGALVAPAAAGSESGNFMVRVQGTVVDPDSSAKVSAGGARLAGADAEVDTEVLPTLTLSYFFNKNIALELFCCFAKLEAEGKGSINGTDLGDFWVFPPALTLQYHFDQFGALKPYVGAGLQYIHFFNEGRSDLGAKIDLDDAVGFTLQAGVDVSLGEGWYLNADVKKTFIETDASWGATGIKADVDIDPWIFSLGVGYRFNLEDVFGRREAAALK
ncbi:OmpW/AlkL family protein [Hyphomicrobium sp.]|uniref:OmpW/AlkL family protein n=1 Tax=Hyphomicrobium sp. TaxID=82 RepID=UPI002E37BAAA|nr:OmpW family outer membrane protein [Hyphomicrobium sp.]HEX2843458.1 OmpW family outer membrane protein [Hyphomicrobium sp.]